MLVEPDSPFDAPQTTDSPLSTGAVMYLTKMQPWHRLLSVLGLLVSAFAVLVGVLTVVVALAEADGTLVLVGGLYALIAGVYGVPAWYLWRSASALQRTKVDPDRAGEALEQSLMHQFTFWRAAGVLTILGLLLYVFTIVAIVGLTAFGSSLATSFEEASIEADGG